jgi:mRNA-degrading endonuclease RelE of RelBE toxin-antitoxin system
MNYQVRLLDEAIRDLAQLDKPIARRIVERVC